VVARPYCRFACPYGVLLNLASRLSWQHVTITPDDCIRCRLCEEACPFGAIRPPTPERPPEPPAAARRRIGLFLALLPALVFLGAWAGGWGGAWLARLHPTVASGEQVWREDAGTAAGTTLESQTFRGTGEPARSLFEDAVRRRARFLGGGRLAGGGLGAALGLSLLGLSARRRRSDYTIHEGECLSCARCFHYCPRERVRRGEKAT
jgi:ferredoxin